MNPRRIVLLALVAIALIGALVGVGLLVRAPSARALPPAGGETLNVTAEVGVTSRLGSETISLTGTVGIERGDPRMDGDVEVVDTEIVALGLAGESLTGPVTVSQSATFASLGEIRSLQAPPDQFPASSFFDVFIDVAVPASPSATLTRHNEEPLHLVPMSDGAEVSLDAWPPVGVTYQVDLDPCLPLLPSLPAEVCVDSISIVMGEEAVPTPTLTPCPPEVCTPTPTVTPSPTATPTITPCPPEVCTPTPTITSTPTATLTPTPMPPPPEDPSFSVASGGPSGLHPADLLGLSAAIAPPSSNDNLDDAWEIPFLPFVGEQNTLGMTTEPGEPLNPLGCVTFTPQVKGATVWYRFTPSSSGTVAAETAGSNFDTVLAVYTRDPVNQALIAVACDDDSGPGLQSEISFSVTPGTTYFLQAGGFSTATGDLVLSVSAPGGGGTVQGPATRIPCANLGLFADGCDDGSDGDQDDVDALSFGAAFTDGDPSVAFSVAPGSVGLPGSAVAQQAACSPAQPQADEFASQLDGTNALVFDGDGLDGGCPTTASLGLQELPSSDDLDALNEEPPSFVDANGDGVLEEAVFFSLASGSLTLTNLGRSPADILWTIGFQPGVYASAAALGLQEADDIDALCLVDEGDGAVYDPAVDFIVFSLAPGSPTLAALGASPADILGPGPRVFIAAGDLGLQESDDLNALKCFSDSGTLPTPAPTPTPTPAGVVGDADCNLTVNSIDTALVLQFVAGLLDSLSCRENADVNENGTVDSIDAALILQFVAGLLDILPP